MKPKEIKEGYIGEIQRRKMAGHTNADLNQALLIEVIYWLMVIADKVDDVALDVVALGNDVSGRKDGN